MVINLGLALLLSRVLWKSAYSRSSMKPKSIPKELGNMFLSFCIHVYASSFMFLSFACMFLSLCIHFLSFSLRVPFICVNFHSFSFRFNSNVHSCPFIFLSFACIFLSFCIHVLSFLSKIMEMALWLGQETECNKCLSLRLSLRLSLNNPSNM